MVKENQVYEVSIKAVVLNDQGKILLAKDEKGLWDIPGGRIEHNESVNDGLKREVREELGVECEILDQRPLFIWPAIGADGAHRFVVGFSVSLNGQDFTISDENVEHGFFGKQDLEKINLYQGVQKLTEWLKV